MPFLRRFRPIPSLNPLTAFSLFAIPIPYLSLRRKGPPILPPIFSRLQFFPSLLPNPSVFEIILRYNHFIPKFCFPLAS